MKSTNHYYRPVGLFILLCLVPIWAFAQSITVRGTVKDAAGEPIIGASVLESGTSNGTITDLDGQFSLRFRQEANLPFLLSGTKNKKYLLPEKTNSPL